MNKTKLLRENVTEELLLGWLNTNAIREQCMFGEEQDSAAQRWSLISENGEEVLKS